MKDATNDLDLATILPLKRHGARKLFVRLPRFPFNQQIELPGFERMARNSELREPVTGLSPTGSDGRIKAGRLD